MRSTVAICWLLASLAWSGPEASPVILRIKNARAHDIVIKNLASKEEIVIPPDDETLFEVMLRQPNLWVLHYRSGLFSELIQNLGELLPHQGSKLRILGLYLSKSESGIFSNTYSIKDGMAIYHTNVDCSLFLAMLPYFIGNESYFVPAREHLCKIELSQHYNNPGIVMLHQQLAGDSLTGSSLTLNKISHMLSLSMAEGSGASAAAAARF